MAGNRGKVVQSEQLKLALILGILTWLLVGLSPATVHAEVTLSSDDYSGYWTGFDVGDKLGDTAANTGDLNGDGSDDFMTKANGNAHRGVWVLFGPPTTTGKNLSELQPASGYRIQTPTDPEWMFMVGDQNGDGVADMAIGEKPNGTDATIVFGVSDPATELSPCEAGSETRCLNTSDPSSADGERWGFKIHNSTSLVSTGAAWGAGDFDGDGDSEILAPAPEASKLLILRNGLGDQCAAETGPCTVDLSTLTGADVMTIGGLPSGVPLGQSGAISPGDVNNDGRDDILVTSGTDGSAQPSAWLVYGPTWSENQVDLSSLDSTSGFKVSLPFSTYGSVPFSPGDFNGDGILDIGIQSVELIPSQGTYFTIIYGQEGTPDRNVNANPPAVSDGVQFVWDPAFSPLPFGALQGVYPASLGDLNGDGSDEFAVGISNAKVDNKSNAGRIVIFQGGDRGSENVVSVGVSTPDSEVLKLGGGTANLRFGSGIAPAGDIDADGVADLAVGATGFGVGNPVKNNAGLLAGVSSAMFYPAVNTSIASVGGTSSVVLAGLANANRRASIAYFEFGVTDEYGQATADQAVGRSPAGRSFDAEVSGLTPDTEYHYRAVIVNDLGIKAYGADRTFKTAAVPVERCEQDATQPGCPEYDGKKFCEANPADAVCKNQSGPKEPGLSSLILSQKTIKVVRGKASQITVTVVNTGNATAKGVKICASAPKRFVSVAKCLKVGSLKAGAVASKTFKVKVKKRARKGKKLVLKLKASASGLGSKTARANLRVR